ncbi:MAG: type II toxin-antitoxin system CcdA family antitoxin [Candidatus Bathyarchaeia archaeon]
MGRLVTVSAKVEKELKKKAQELGLNVSAVVRRSLKEEVERIELRNILESLKREVEASPRLPDGSIVRIIRDMRRGISSP